MERKSAGFTKWINISTILGFAAIIAFVIYGFSQGIFSSMESFKAYVTQFGFWTPLLFILIQAVQVVIPFLPAPVGCVAGVIIFGPVFGFIYNYAGICIGSTAAFLLSRKYGRNFVKNMVSEKNYEKYATWLDKKNRFNKMFAAAIILPVAPDDLLCYLAGLTKMTLNRFVTILLLGKPIGLLCYSFGITEGLKLLSSFL